jgi:acetoin utilization deacetylase AcuC-like enzyme
MKLVGHVFPAVKFEMIYNFILFDEELSKAEIFHPNPATVADLELVHTTEYIQDFLNTRNTPRTSHSELPLNQMIVEAVLYGTGGTILATELTKKYDFVYNIGGGFHHSFPDHAEGFCYVNDVAIATKKYLFTNPDHRVLIIDLDLHQGNGTAFIFEKDPRVFTFSMHQENLYPIKQKSTLDIGLPDYCKDGEYLYLLRHALDKIRREFHPNLIYYLAGADPFQEDKLGNLQISKNGLRERDLLVKGLAKHFHVPVVIVTAGGYAKLDSDTVSIHVETAKCFYRKDDGIF